MPPPEQQPAASPPPQLCLMWELLGRLWYSCHPQAYSSTLTIFGRYWEENILKILSPPVAVVLVHRLHLLVPSLVDGLLHLGRPGLDQQVECRSDEGEANVLDNLGLLGGNRDGALLQVDLTENITVIDSQSC